MQPIFKILLVLNVFLAGCTKETSFEKQPDGFYISCSIDGIPKTYIALAIGDRTDPGNGGITIYGVFDTTNNDFISLAVNSVDLVEPVTAGEYTDTTTGLEVRGGFGDLTSRIVYNAGPEVVELARSGGIKIRNHLKISITELTYRTIRGTFNGDFYQEADPRGAIKKVTDGSFYVRMN